MVDLTHIETELHNINKSLSQDNDGYNLIVPHLDKIAKSLTDINKITIQNEDALQIAYTNKPTYLDYMTAWGTISAVIVSLLLGVIIPLIKKCINKWKNRVKIKLKYIEYYYDEAKNVAPTFYIDFKNLYEYQLYIKKVFFFIEFKGNVLPIILRLQPCDIAILPPLSEIEMVFSISSDICKDRTITILNEDELINFINKTHVHRNKISPFDEIKTVYLSLDTNLGQFKISVPKWLRDESSSTIVGLFMKDISIYSDNIVDIDNIKNLNISLKKFYQKKYRLGKKRRRKELLRWKMEDICYYLPFGCYLFEKFFCKKDD